MAASAPKSIVVLRNLANAVDQFRALTRYNEAGCLIWQGAQQSNGYGVIRLEGHRFSAHRLSCELHHGLFPQDQTGLGVLHKCDVKLCCNPDHLYLGTTSQNARDRADRCLMSTGRRLWSRTTDAEATEPVGTVYYEFRGEIRTLFEWAELLGLHPQTLDLRLQAGWSEEDVLSKPHGGVKRKTGVATYKRFSGMRAVQDYLASL